MTRSRRDLRWDVCTRCPNFSVGPPAVCRKLSGALIEHMASPGPFCPIGLHAALPVAATVSGAASAPARSCRLRGLLSAALKLLLVLLRVCRAERAVVAARREVCRGCEHQVRRIGLLRVCNKCGCLTRAKTALAPEGCPVGRWSPEASRCVALEELECLGLVSPCRTGGCGK